MPKTKYLFQFLFLCIFYLATICGAIAKSQFDVSGFWNTDWGPMQINATPVTGGTYSISGYWMQGDERGEIKSGTYDPNTGSIRFHFSMPTINQQGDATLKLSPEGRSVSGTYIQNNQDPVNLHMNRPEAKFIVAGAKPASSASTAKANPVEKSEPKKDSTAPITLDQAQMVTPAKVINGLPIGGRAVIPIPHFESPILVKSEGCKKRLKINSDVLFDPEKSELNEGSARTLVVLGPVVRDFGNHPVLVEGHTDAVGSEEEAQKLSEARAQAVLDWLNKTRTIQGIATMKGFGSKVPIAPNQSGGTDNPTGRAKNRRIEVTIDTCLKVERVDKKLKMSSAEYNEGMEAISKQDWEAAASCFQRALVENREDMDAHFQMGFVKNQSKDYGTAVDELNRVIEKDPNDADANLQIGIAYMQWNRVYEALQYLKKSCELNPKNAQAVYQLALAYKKSNDTENFNAQKKILEELDAGLAGKLDVGLDP